MKWLLVHFLAQLPANEEKDYYLEEQSVMQEQPDGQARMVMQEQPDDQARLVMEAPPEVRAPQTLPEVRVLQTPEGRTVLENGAVRAELAPPKASYLFGRIETEQHIYCLLYTSSDR